jgi:hypothetical protein
MGDDLSRFLLAAADTVQIDKGDFLDGGSVLILFAK